MHPYYLSFGGFTLIAIVCHVFVFTSCLYLPSFVISLIENSECGVVNYGPSAVLPPVSCCPVNPLYIFTERVRLCAGFCGLCSALAHCVSYNPTLQHYIEG